jgi:hypothetical protein
MAQSLGVIDIVWRGKRLIVEKGAKIKLSGLQNQTQVYGRGATRSQEYVAGEVECTTPLLAGQKASEVYTVQEGELQCQLDTGQTIVSYDAWMTDRNDLTGGEGGKAGLKWGFAEYEEIS